jgi:hypothetical protein
MAVRRQAALELPHILVLIDDPEDLVMGAARRAADLPGTDTVYDFVLMQSGGRIRGRYITGDDAVSPIVAALEKLSHRSDLLFAVGDGNHSLASAREVWIEKKAAGAPGDDPARYALVEVENIHDPGLPFHPIHRVLFGIDPDSLSRKILSALRAEVRNDDARGSVEQDLIGPPETGRLGVVQGVRTEVWEFPLTGGRLVAEVIQETLDEVLQTLDGVTIDYIHGEDAVRDLTRETDDRLGFILPPVDKKKFFPRITEVGPYPRKTFSIGEAVEKRYYLEARRIEAGIE